MSTQTARDASRHGKGALFGKSLCDIIDFLNSAMCSEIFGKIRLHGVIAWQRKPTHFFSYTHPYFEEERNILKNLCLLWSMQCYYFFQHLAFGTMGIEVQPKS